MRWPERRKTQTGDTRIRAKFLLLPKTVNGETRWLEKATWLEEYDGSWKHYDLGFGEWRGVEWLDQQRPAQEAKQ